MQPYKHEAVSKELQNIQVSEQYMKTSLNFSFTEFHYDNLVSGITKEFILAEYQ